MKCNISTLKFKLNLVIASFESKIFIKLKVAKRPMQDDFLEKAHKIIGQNVKNAREKAGLTQLQLALEIGHKSVGLVSCAEIYHKKQHFNIEHLLKIAIVLNVSVEVFFKGIDEVVEGKSCAICL